MAKAAPEFGDNAPLIAHWLSPFRTFARIEASGGLVLVAAAAVALIWANSGWSQSYFDLWKTRVGFTFGGFSLYKSLEHWINDGLMAVFFFTVGLEIKREILAGELDSLRKAVGPVGAALGGMAVPAIVYLSLNAGAASARGWAVPMATDIAFALGVLSLLGKRVPLSLKVFLTAVAIVDDLGAVVVIAIFYTSRISPPHLLAGAAILALLLGLNAAGVRKASPYAILAFLLWIAFLKSGLHATIAGVLAAWTIPARTRYAAPRFAYTARSLVDAFERCPAPARKGFITKNQIHALEGLEQAAARAGVPLQRLEHALHPWTAFAIMPVFALANAGVPLNASPAQIIASPASLGVLLGLVLGKQLGVFAGAWLAIRSGLGHLPEGLDFRHVHGAAALSGIGFTMSIFIANLAFPADQALADAVKLAVLAASALSGGLGYLLLRTKPG
jgi:NhaA family Na+:H+ antiporter